MKMRASLASCNKPVTHSKLAVHTSWIEWAVPVSVVFTQLRWPALCGVNCGVQVADRSLLFRSLAPRGCARLHSACGGGQLDGLTELSLVACLLRI